MNKEVMQLTARQAEVLDFIAKNSHLYGPSVREIAAGLSIKSLNGVVCHLRALEKKGRIERTPGQARNIRVCK